jgi:1,6-anhydro-N-acetylmuramate kinase
MSSGMFAQLAWDFGQLHCDVIDGLTAPAQESISVICVHGQTVFHQPPISWQVMNPAPIAARFKCPVVSDLRQADLAAGGQGAPITPIADWILFRHPDQKRAIINLGGFCNITILPAGDDHVDEIAGFDVCACNQVLDAVARNALHSSFDRDGAAAKRGRAKPQAAQALYQILCAQRQGNRSLGTGDEATQWVMHHLKQVPPDDLAATAVDALARTIADALGSFNVDELVVAGGGAHHRTLLEHLGRAAGKPLITTSKLGVPIEAREAVAFAVLGALCADGVPITLPQVTGCASPAPLSGSWQLPASHINATAMLREAPAPYRE